VRLKLEGLLLFILAGFAVSFLWMTKDYGATAALFPRVVAIASLGFIALDLFGQLSRREKTSAAPRAATSETSGGVSWSSALALQAVYIGLIYVVGFSTATISYLIACPWHLRFRSWTVIVVHGVLLTVTIVYTFHSIFHVRLPKGMLGIPW
jgi:hypothetical protein